MKTSLILARREWAAMRNAPATYVIATLFLLLTGWLFAASLFEYNQSVLDAFARPLPLIFTFLMPALSMRLFAEELRSGTMETLATLPVTDTEIVLGKFVGLMGLLKVLLAFTLVYPLALVVIGRPDPGHVAGTYLAIVCLGAFFGAIGLWASTLSRNQVVSFIVAFFVCFLFFIMGRVAELFPEAAAGFVRAFGVDAHYDALLRGVLDTKDLVYWLGGTAFFLAATLSSLYSRRWK